MQADSDEVVDAIGWKEAVLDTLFEGPAVGYELQKWFDAGVVIARCARPSVEKEVLA
jgi:hypothetical protein